MYNILLHPPHPEKKKHTLKKTTKASLKTCFLGLGALTVVDICSILDPSSLARWMLCLFRRSSGSVAAIRRFFHRQPMTTLGTCWRNNIGVCFRWCQTCYQDLHYVFFLFSILKSYFKEPKCLQMIGFADVQILLLLIHRCTGVCKYCRWMR